MSSDASEASAEPLGEELTEPEPTDPESAVDAEVESEAALEMDGVGGDFPTDIQAPSTADSGAPDQADTAADLEGPRRRARRERAERRAVQQRAMAIEEARREAKRRARGEAGPEPPRLADRTVKGLKLVVWLVVLTVLTVVLGLALYFTPLMSARSLVVIGTGVVPTEEVVQAAAIQMGTPLLQIDTDEVADRVAGIRRVASARVQREYPSAVRITVVERIPVVFKDFPDGPHLFDRDGVDFVTGPPPPGLAYLDVDNPGPTDPPTTAALAVMTSLRPEVVAQVSRVAAPSVAAITLTLIDGRTVVWGTTDRTDEKSEKLAALLTQPGRVYDVSSPDLPTVK